MSEEEVEDIEPIPPPAPPAPAIRLPDWALPEYEGPPALIYDLEQLQKEYPEVNLSYVQTWTPTVKFKIYVPKWRRNPALLPKEAWEQHTEPVTKYKLQDLERIFPEIDFTHLSVLPDPPPPPRKPRPPGKKSWWQKIPFTLI